ncbi:Hypothetical protein PMT_2465 [Prochlorococcus marinus str. MIT 9313]|uniref:Uncharacterized protein n=1 Tax=Prochlorococcus marinus (strain MIT 9313) TaxID=74547 RepID=B9ERA4_PROMM|nr:Hypothetical protein PMT_2465 [Prochlorococcus marinus str. MIT 9313]
MTGVFYCFNPPKKPINLHLIPDTIANKTATACTHPVTQCIYKKCKAEQIKPQHL